MGSLSPLDGRYQEIVAPLATVFSEEGLVKKRVAIEIAYLKALVAVPDLGVAPLTREEIQTLDAIAAEFGGDDFARIKKIELSTKHDVKAAEYYIREELRAKSLERLVPWVHFAITSEDVNNIAQTLQLKEGSRSLLVQGQALQERLGELVEAGQGAVMVGRTHGQPAIPTTMGKELLVFALELQELWEELHVFSYTGKVTGAVGTLAAHTYAYPQVDWLDFTQKFVASWGLHPETVTVQIVPSGNVVKLFSLLARLNLQLVHLCQDLWWYTSLGYFLQKTVNHEVGSSTMPQKVNPIFIENAEGNAQLSAALSRFFVEKLSITRLQRDLSDSTVRRNFGVAYGHLFVALSTLQIGLGRLQLNAAFMRREVENHPEMMAEALQTLLRKLGKPDAYEAAKSFFRGHEFDRAGYETWVKSLGVDGETAEQLLALEPPVYTGVAQKLVEQKLPELKKRIIKLT